MPEIHEIYGKSLEEMEQADCSHAWCPFTESLCDGGGNRNQTKIKLTNHVLRPLFDTSLDSIIPGVCSIDYGQESWVVRPRRLFGFKHNLLEIPPINRGLQDHEREILIQTGLPQNQDLGIWAEVYLNYQEERSEVNYHFDFVIASLTYNSSFQDIIKQYDLVDEEEIADFVKAARQGGYLVGRYDPDLVLQVLPSLKLDHLTIIEVMTASTSGSNKSKSTDMASAFTNAMLGNPHQTAGINKRQVWGRMATQLFAKSALAESWDARVFWIVQEQLLNNLEQTTKLDVKKLKPAKSDNINFVSMEYNNDETSKNVMTLKNVYKVSSGVSVDGNQTCTDILLPNQTPSKKELMKSILRRNLVARVKL